MTKILIVGQSENVIANLTKPVIAGLTGNPFETADARAGRA